MNVKALSDDSKQTELASGFTVAQYETACDEKDKNKIADALHSRFKERYIEPIICENKHGFAMMAISCLMIEALESFHQGWENSDRKSKEAFHGFFGRHSRFKVFRSQSAEFWKNVRCGILHQAETTGGWRITRKKDAPLFDAASHTINATKFLQHLRKVLVEFCEALKTAEWNSAEWKNARKKMNALCRNCRP